MSESTDGPETTPKRRGRPRNSKNKGGSGAPRKSKDVAELEAQRDAIQAKIDKLNNQHQEEAARAGMALGAALLIDPEAEALVGEWLGRAIETAKGKEKAWLELAAVALAAAAKPD